jgi:hypothetical protein
MVQVTRSHEAKLGESQHVNYMAKMRKYVQVWNMNMQAVAHISLESRERAGGRPLSSSFCNVNAKYLNLGVTHKLWLIEKFCFHFHKQHYNINIH